MRQLPKNGISAANAHALILWQLLSNYVHYSALTEALEHSMKTRRIEMLQLKEILSYSYKGLLIASDALNKFGLQHDVKDPSNLKDELMSGFIDVDNNLTKN